MFPKTMAVRFSLNIFEPTHDFLYPQTKGIGPLGVQPGARKVKHTFYQIDFWLLSRVGVLHWRVRGFALEGSTQKKWLLDSQVAAFFSVTVAASWGFECMEGKYKDRNWQSRWSLKLPKRHKGLYPITLGL